MGTNYYWHPKGYCEACDRPKGDGVHIGKSSSGWVFALHVCLDDMSHEDLPRATRITSLDDWRALFGQPGSVIVTEYGDRQTVDEMIGIITDRSWHGNPGTDPFGVPGPNGLLRRTIDGVSIIGHGDGTWDLCAGEFS